MKYKFGSNYVPSGITMSMKEEEMNRKVIGIIDDDVDDLGNAIQVYNQNFKEFGLCIFIRVRKLISLVQKCMLFHLFKSVDHGCFG